MAMHFRCPCGEAIFAPDGSAGKKGECYSCGKIVVVPGEAIVTGAAMPGRRAPAPSFDEQPVALRAPAAIEVEEAPAEAMPVAMDEAPPVIEVQEPAPLVMEELPAAMEEAPPLVEEEFAPFAELREDLAEAPLAASPPVEPAAPVPLVEELPAVEDIPDLVTIEPRAPTEELSAPPPPARRPPARSPSRRKPRAPEEPTRIQKKPARAGAASKRERPAKASRAAGGAKPSRAARPSRRSARRPSKKRAALCRSCGMELRPGEAICQECGAKVGGSSIAVYVLIIIIVVILVAIAFVATAAAGVLPEPVQGHVQRVIEMAGLTPYFARFSALVTRTETSAVKEEPPAPPEAE